MQIDQKFFGKILEEIPSCIFFKDKDCKYVFATHYWHHLNQDGDESWSIEGKTDLEIRKNKENAMKAMEADKKIIETGIPVEYVICEEEDGVTDYLQIIKRPVRDDDGNVIGIVGLINDVAHEKVLEKKVASYIDCLKVASETDPLTGLCNRRSADERIRGLLGIKSKSMFCLMDVDKFKYINDTFGHDTGDKVLVFVANVLKRSFRDTDVIIRLGGDEFGIFSPGVKTERDAHMLIKRIYDYLAEMDIPELNGHKITVSMGACFSKPDSDMDSMYKQADALMYKCKRREGNSYEISFD